MALNVLTRIADALESLASTTGQIKNLLQYSFGVQPELVFKDIASGLVINPDSTGAISITDFQSMVGKVSDIDIAGNPVIIHPAQLSWSVADMRILSATKNANGTATFKFAGTLGSTQITVTDGEDVKATIHVTVGPSKPTKLVVTEA